MASKRKQPPAAAAKKPSSKKGKPADSDEESNKAAEAKAGSDGSAEEKANSDESDDEIALWVQCATCTKWRRMPPTLSHADLPEQWYCHMNEYDSTRNTCEDSEEEQPERFDENDEDVENDDDARPRRKRLPTDAAACDAARRAFCENLIKQAVLEETGGSKVPGKRGNSGGSSSSRTNGSMVWVQCCNLNCGKWRHVWKAHNDPALDGSRLWFCVQNTFDERIASCGAPQETALDREFEVQLRPKLVLTGAEPHELPEDDPAPEIIAKKRKTSAPTTRAGGSMSTRGAAAQS
jgi:CW-type Zinc Finger